MIQPGAVKMMLCDISGHALITLMDAQPVSAGRHQQSIDLSSLASGAYYLLTIIDGRQLIRKIIVQQ